MCGGSERDFVSSSVVNSKDDVRLATAVTNEKPQPHQPHTSPTDSHRKTLRVFRAFLNEVKEDFARPPSERVLTVDEQCNFEDATGRVFQN